MIVYDLGDGFAHGKFAWAVTCVKQWLNPKFVNKAACYTPISPSMWTTSYINKQKRMIDRARTKAAALEKNTDVIRQVE